MVTFGGYKSDCKTIVSRVPQGSVLGSLLHLIYTADLSGIISTSDIHSHSDDTQIVHFFDIENLEDSVRNLNSDVQKLCKVNHNLTINPTKSKVTVIYSENRKKI